MRKNDIGQKVTKIYILTYTIAKTKTSQRIPNKEVKSAIVYITVFTLFEKPQAQIAKHKLKCIKEKDRKSILLPVQVFS